MIGLAADNVNRFRLICKKKKAIGFFHIITGMDADFPEGLHYDGEGWTHIREIARKVDLLGPTRRNLMSFPYPEGYSYRPFSPWIERNPALIMRHVEGGNWGLIEGFPKELFKFYHELWFCRRVVSIPDKTLEFAALTDDELLDKAKHWASRSTSVNIVFQNSTVDIEDRSRVEFDLVEGMSDVDIMKRNEPSFYLRHFRKIHRQQNLHISQMLELVGDHKGKAATRYVSPHELRLKKSADERKDEYARKHYLMNVNAEVPKPIQIASILETSKAAKEGQLYAIAKGMEQVATKRGWDFSMLTITLPGEWHSARSGRASGRQSEWNESSVTDACRELQDRWNGISTRIKQLTKKHGNGEGFGFAVREPHADGTPHLHVLYMAPRAALVAIRDYLLSRCEVDGETHQEPAGVFETTKTKLYHFLAWRSADEMIEKGKAASSPATYLFKYLSKGVQAEDVSAWRYCAGIRQTSWVNFKRGFVAKWQAIYKHKEGEEVSDAGFMALVEAMAERRYGAVLEVLCGLEEGVELEPIRREEFNDYGETRSTVVGFSLSSGVNIFVKDLDAKYLLLREEQVKSVPVNIFEDEKKFEKS